MDFESREKKSWADKGGVSEVVGNILILMITVVLFSGIVAFVQQMPVPQQLTKADFSASVSFSDNYRHVNLTLVHAGGQVLDISKVKIIVNRDGTNFGYSPADGANFNGTSWTTGKSWTHQVDGTTATSSIIVTVVDLAKSNAIWTSQVTGGQKGNPPNILQRYVDAYPDTSTPDPVKENDTFSFYAKVEDPDGDLNHNNVWIDASGVNIPGSNGDHRAWSTDVNGLFNWTFGKVWNATAIDGSVIIIHAIDIAGHETISSYILHITVLPSEINLLPYTQFGAESGGLPLYLTYVSATLGHGFGFYRELVTNGTLTGNADTNAPTTEFTKESKIFVRFASLSISNLNAQNSISISDTRTGTSISPNFPAGSNSTPAAPFYQIGAGGNAFVYECMFDTTNLPPSSYTVSMMFMNRPVSGATPTSFQAYQMITIDQEGAPYTFIPTLQLFEEQEWLNPWGTSRETAYDVSSATTNTVYVGVVMQNTDPFSPTIAQVRISDMSGGSELYGSPPAGSMISSVSPYGDGYRYSFTIGLRLNNGNQWLPGVNSYTLYVTKVNDSNEGIYSLSQQIWINGASGRQDFFVGTDGLSTGNANFITRYYPYYIQNNNFFTRQSLWYYENSPSACVDYTMTAMGVGDLDGDGGKDILMGQAYSNDLVVFSNSPGNYGSWQPASTIYRPDGRTYPVTWIAFGDMNGDGIQDFAYSSSNSQVVLYNNTYGTRGWVFNPAYNHWTGTISKIDLKDMTNDGRADLVMLAGGRIWIYDLKYAYDPVLKTTAPSKILWMNSSGNGIKSFDVKDMNVDGRLDIATVGNGQAFGSNIGGNVNLYDLVGSEQYVKINPNATGFTPRLGDNCSYSGEVSYTQTANDGLVISFTESVGGSENRVNATMRFDQLVSTTPDQILRVRAMISPGTPETFYVWISPDNNVYNYVGQVDKPYYKYYNFTLPAAVMGTQMYVKFTDSLMIADDTPDTIYVDYLAVVTSAPGFIEKPFSNDPSWLVVRAMNVDGLVDSSNYMDVIAAKNGAGAAMNIFHWTGTSYSIWGANPNNIAPPGSASFAVSCSAYVNDLVNYPFSTLAPTLFDATDINGDGFTDILVANLTTSGGNAVSIVGYYMNLYSGGTPSWRYFTVSSWNISPPQKGPTPYVDILLSASLFG